MSRVARLFKILQTSGRYRLDELLPAEHLRPLARFVIWLSPWRLKQSPELPIGVRLRKTLEELGPVFIKFGQLLSTRRDLLPDDIANELAQLQDNVPPFSEQESIAIIERALGKPVTELFATFEATPMASASVAQVHAATLHSGEDVVVKVVRPDIEATIRQDIALLFTLARLIETYFADGRRLRPVAVVADYELNILDELDLGREAANASQLRRNFQGSPLLYVPQIYWNYSCRNVFVMERIKGVAVTDLERLRNTGTNLKLLAERGVELFFTQVFRDSFFHADMHPGNVFIDATNPADPSFIAIDCALIGSLSDSDQYYLARNLLSIFKRDYREVAQLHVECGWVPAHTRVQDFESAMRAVCEPVFERPISEISFGQLLVYLFSTARRFDMEVQPTLVLLQKTLLSIEDLGRQLYPELNLWHTAQPFLERWVEERYSPETVMRRLERHAPNWLEQLPQLPDAVLEGLQQVRAPERVATLAPGDVARTTPKRRTPSIRQVTGGICALAALVMLPGAQQLVGEVPNASWLLAALALFLWWPNGD